VPEADPFAKARAERLDRRFLGREQSGHARQGHGRQRGPFSGGEDAGQEPLPEAGQGRFHAFELDHIQPQTDDHASPVGVGGEMPPAARRD
jgi:hypothetical protein